MMLKWFAAIFALIFWLWSWNWSNNLKEKLIGKIIISQAVLWYGKKFRMEMPPEVSEAFLSYRIVFKILSFALLNNLFPLI